LGMLATMALLCLVVSNTVLSRLSLASTTSVVVVELLQHESERQKHDWRALLDLPTYIYSTASTDLDSHQAHSWVVGLVAKPILLEVGGLLACQLVGIPVLSKAIATSRRFLFPLAKHTVFRHLFFANTSASRLLLRRIIGSSRNARLVLRPRMWLRRARPSTWRRLQRTAIKMFKNRSKISAASDLTHVIGNDIEEG
jgi:hypothetical protein